MPRLCDRAFDILAAEVDRLGGSDPLQKVRKDIVLKRLEKFRQIEGPPLTLSEMRETVIDIFPNFSETVLKQAAKANGIPIKKNTTKTRLGCMGATVLGVVGLTGTIWLLNLPYPMIRWPVARTAPILLLPSFLKMDRDYRQTISLVAQADQLVNQATSFQDIDLGSEKVTQAQKHLDGLPVWFLGYYPKAYCGFFGCAWRFTFDEFRAARSEVGRMEARVFQEKNSQTLLENGTATVDSAKQTYETAATTAEKTAALADWQAGMDQLNEIPKETLAGRMAQTKLTAYTRDYEQISGTVAGGTRSNTLIEAAQAFALTAAQESQNPPYPAETWGRIADLWTQAIERLNQVPVDDVGYAEAQRLLADYTNNLGIIKNRMAAEKAAVEAFSAAQQKTTALLARDLTAMTPNQIASELQSITNDLYQVKPGTTPYAEAKEMLRSAEEKLKQLKP